MHSNDFICYNGCIDISLNFTVNFASHTWSCSVQFSTSANPIIHFFYPKNLHSHCFRFLLGHLHVPREIKYNYYYAKFLALKMMYYGICKSKEYKESMLLGNLSYQLKLLGREAMQCITLRNESNKLLFQDFSNFKVSKWAKWAHKLAGQNLTKVKQRHLS